jgi:hypothetical protein
MATIAPVSAAPSSIEAPNASRQLLASAYSLAANTAIPSTIGMDFWLVAAWLHSNGSSTLPLCPLGRRYSALALRKER